MIYIELRKFFRPFWKMCFWANRTLVTSSGPKYSFWEWTKNFGAPYMGRVAIKWCFVTPYDIYRVEKNFSSILEDVFLSKLDTCDVIRAKMQLLRVNKKILCHLYARGHHKMVFCLTLWYISSWENFFIHFWRCVFEKIGHLWCHQAQNMSRFSELN